eukprot:GAHX01001298.1.p1 GENE.GAHX01001298.1~~GAHX01001298.1.p1  ORF type:complete len:323 (-),score=46.13 GAHX01001298.1:804-1772(-)
MFSESIYGAMPAVFATSTTNPLKIIANDKTILIQTNKTSCILYLIPNGVQDSSTSYHIFTSHTEIKFVDCKSVDNTINLLYLSEHRLFNIQFSVPLNRLNNFTNKAKCLISSDFRFLEIWKPRQDSKIEYIGLTDDYKVISFNIKEAKDITDVQNITQVMNKHWLKSDDGEPVVFNYYTTTIFVKFSSFILSIAHSKKDNKFISTKISHIQICDKLSFLNSFELSFSGRELQVKKKIKPEKKSLYFRSEISAVRLIKNFVIILTKQESLYLKNSDLIKFFNSKEETEGHLWAKLEFMNDRIKELKSKIDEKDDIIKNNYSLY